MHILTCIPHFNLTAFQLIPLALVDQSFGRLLIVMQCTKKANILCYQHIANIINQLICCRPSVLVTTKKQNRIEFRVILGHTRYQTFQLQLWLLLVVILLHAFFAAKMILTWISILKFKPLQTVLIHCKKVCPRTTSYCEHERSDIWCGQEWF